MQEFTIVNKASQAFNIKVITFLTALMQQCERCKVREFKCKKRSGATVVILNNSENSKPIFSGLNGITNQARISYALEDSAILYTKRDALITTSYV